jgi:DNA-binding FadR family transcriptional regulator
MTLTSPLSSPGGSRVQQAIEAVTRHIRERDLRVGDTLPGEAHFAAEQGVSRAVIREAFGALAALRLIDVGNGRKPKVSAIDGSVMATSLGHAVSTAQVSVAEVWDVRRTLEVRTAALAARWRSEAEAAELLALSEAMASEIDDLPQMTRHDIALHQLIARASRNALFVQIVSSFAPLMEVAVPAAWRTRVADAQRDIMVARHRAVAKAIAAGDEAAASAAMENHFDASIGDILRATPELRASRAG